MPPVVSIVGRSKSGKTTLLEKLIGELAARGYRVAAIKHAPDVGELDTLGKDSWRHLRAGGQAAVLCSEDRMMLIKPLTKGATLGELVRTLGEDYDLVLTEGFKRQDAPKIEVHRREVGPPLGGVKKIIAVVTDEPLETKGRQFALGDIKDLADFIESGFILPQRERLSVYVNGSLLSLSSFPRQFISNVLVAMVSSLKGVGGVSRLDISLRRGEKGEPGNQPGG